MNPETAREAANAASYALNRHVPDMARGFAIGTAYGELAITADEARQHPEMRNAVEFIMQFRLYAGARAQRPRKAAPHAASHRPASTATPFNPGAADSPGDGVELARSLGIEDDRIPSLAASIAAMLDAGIPAEIVRGMVEASSRLLNERAGGAA